MDDPLVSRSSRLVASAQRKGMRSRILVTGSTGLLGSDLVRLLSERGVESRGWSRRGRLPEEQMDLADEKPARVIERLREYQPGIVVHTAAMSNVDECELDPEAAMKNNAQAVEKVARSCESLSPKAVLIALSTDYVFDGRLDRPYREEDPTHPLSVYGRSKLEGEKTALVHASHCLIVRVSGLFGSARSNFVTQSVQRLKERKPVPVVTDQKYSPSYTEDCAQGIYRLIEKIDAQPEAAGRGGKLYGTLHLVNHGGATRFEVAHRIAQLLQIDSPDSLIQPTTWVALHRPAQRPLNSQLECRRFVKICGNPLRPWQEALAAFLKSMELDQKAVP